MKIKRQSCNFEEDYFEDYFKGNADVSEKRKKEMNNLFVGMFRYLEKYVNIKDGAKKKAFEFGCSVGYSSKLLYDRGFTVTGTDVSKYAVRIAKKEYPEINFFVHDAQKPLPKKNYYDLVVAFDVIEHLENPSKTVKNMLNMINDKGVVICSTPNVYKHTLEGDPSHINVKRPEEWRKIFKSAGFKKIIIKQVMFFPFLYRFHWRLHIAFPFACSHHLFLSPVFIIARK